MNTNNTVSTNPANRNRREFNLGRDHTVGQFLNAHPEAKRVLLANRAEGIKSGMFSLQMRASMA
jgi:hypothetical protein